MLSIVKTPNGVFQHSKCGGGSIDERESRHHRGLSHVYGRRICKNRAIMIDGDRINIPFLAEFGKVKN